MQALKLPAGAWDSHTHVIDETRFPFVRDPPYRPGKATLSELLQFEKSLGIDNVCLVAVSVYENDNRSILDALRSGSGGSRAVVSLDPQSVTEEELDGMHEYGVRGIRLNLKTKGQAPSRETLAATLRTYAARLKTRDWILQLYLGLEQLAMIADVVPDLGIRVVLDHMGSPDPSSEAASQDGYRELLDLLAKGEIWVKISGFYRFADLPDLDAFARKLIKAGPNNVVWASDWPHTGGPTKVLGGRLISTYRQIQIEDIVRRCFEWCDHDERMIENLFVRNPRRLWLG